jgi:hypothetical protein
VVAEAAVASEAAAAEVAEDTEVAAAAAVCRGDVAPSVRLEALPTYVERRRSSWPVSTRATAADDGGAPQILTNGRPAQLSENFKSSLTSALRGVYPSHRSDEFEGSLFVKIACGVPRSCHRLGDIIYAAQIELDRALRMIKLGHPVDKGEQMVSVHVEGAGVKIPISIDRHRDLLVSNKERR